MDKKENLRAGIAEMRSVAQRLNQWADDLEATFQDQKTPKSEMGEPATVPKRKKSGSEGPAAPAQGSEPAADEEKKASLTLPEVRAVLAEKCAAGFSTQVKALIESYGVSSLKNVPPEHYAELVAAVRELGDANAG